MGSQVRSSACPSWLARIGVVVLASALSSCAEARDPASAANHERGATQVVPPSPPPPPPPPPPPAQPALVNVPELPRGGRTLFPDYQLVGFCGTPGGAPALGRLAGNLNAKATVVQSYADKYAIPRRKILPVFELIAVVVQSFPGPDGMYRRRVDDSVVEQYLRAARQAKALLLLNIQPGASDFVSEVQHFDKYLHEPDVGIALDPEWAMKRGQKPGRRFGQTTGETINEIAAYMSSIVAHDNLPEKALVFHQVNGWVVKNEAVLKAPPGVAIIDSVDGLGPKAAKIKTYDYLMGLKTAAAHPGFKLFFDEDRQNGGILMTPAEVLKLAPPPEYVMYE